MRKFIRSRFLVALVLTIMTFTTINCGYILYPERRGNPPGQIDTGSLVMDILWLIPGIIPGVIALVVDFTTGAIYLGGGRREGKHHYSLNEKPFTVHPGDKIALNLMNPVPANSIVDVTLASEANRDNSVTLIKRKFAKGDEAKNIIMLTIPKELNAGTYVMAVKVNGIESSSLSLNVTI